MASGVMGNARVLHEKFSKWLPYFQERKFEFEVQRYRGIQDNMYDCGVFTVGHGRALIELILRGQSLEGNKELPKLVDQAKVSGLRLEMAGTILSLAKQN